MKTILFVCSGNTCRSPLAEGYFNDLAEKKNLREKWTAVSAGLHAFEGSPANEQTRLAALADNIDLSNHRSRPVTARLLREAFLILTMTREHKEEMLKLFPESAGKVHVFKEFVGQRGDIPDPIGLGEEFYRTIYREIKEITEQVLEKIARHENRLGL